MEGNNISETKSRFQKWLRPALGAAAVVIVLAILLVTQPWGLSLQSVIARAYATTENLQSYRVFSFTTYMYETKTVDITWEIEFAAPDCYHVRVTVDDDVNEVIIIGDKQYAREPRGGKVIASVIEKSFPGKEDTLRLLDQLTDLEKLLDESVEGIECLHYRGRIDAERIVEKQKAKLDPEQIGYNQILKGLERLRNAKTEVELWIGKDDYLIRQVKQYWEFPKVETASRSTEQEIWHTANIMWKYYDLNEPIEIEPPTTSGELLPGWCLVSSPSVSGPPKELTFSRDVTFTIGGEDPARQQISFRITITNISEEVASNVRVTVHTMATNEETRSKKMEAEPSTPSPVDLEPGESETFHITWEYDASHTSKEELARLVDLTTVLARYTTPEGEEAVELLFPDAPYPSKTPPESPPNEEAFASYEEAKEKVDFPSVYLPIFQRVLS